MTTKLCDSIKNALQDMIKERNIICKCNLSFSPHTTMYNIIMKFCNKNYLYTFTELDHLSYMLY